MKQLLTARKLQSRLLALMLPSLVLVACDNQLNISPTAPTFTQITGTAGAVRNLQISGSLAAEQGSCLKATILFDGQEIDGARSRCQDPEGCAELELAGVIGAFAGHHTITFKVLRQSAETDEYLARGIVEISTADLQIAEPVTLDLGPKRGSLQAGEGLTFEIDLLD